MAEREGEQGSGIGPSTSYANAVLLLIDCQARKKCSGSSICGIRLHENVVAPADSPNILAGSASLAGEGDRKMVSDRFRILGIPGSLRRASYNRGLLRSALEVAPNGVDIELVDLAPIPLFNADVEARGDPEPVREFKERIRAADALLIATPEYNYNIPGVLKNAIDWASRPPADSVLRQKPIALMGAFPGRFGTARSQLALRQVFVFTGSFVLVKPELMVSGAAQLFDAEGNLRDEETRRRIRGLIDALMDWAARVELQRDHVPLGS